MQANENRALALFALDRSDEDKRLLLYLILKTVRSSRNTPKQILIKNLRAEFGITETVFDRALPALTARQGLCGVSVMQFKTTTIVYRKNTIVENWLSEMDEHEKFAEFCV